ncbi:hypothetical protein D5045_26530 [Verminephrobacter eiseniae]|nr:hypothetical protein [Verminephrobacter eiseniae]
MLRRRCRCPSSGRRRPRAIRFGSDSVAKSFVSAKAERRQYECMASGADKVHKCTDDSGME